MRTRETERIAFTWLSTSEAAERLGIEPEQVRKLGRRGALTMVDVNEGGRQPSWRIEESSVEAYIKRNTAGEPESDAA